MRTIKKFLINRISVAGFKSIKRCDIELRALNVLIGSNGAGKSNFLSAFTLLQNILSEELVLYIAKSGMNSIFYNGVKTTDSLSFNIHFSDPVGRIYSFELEPTEHNSVIFSKEEFYENTVLCVGEKATAKISGGHSESLLNHGIGYEADKNKTQTLKDMQFRVYHFHDTGKEAKLKSEQRVSNNKVLLHDAANLAAILYRLRCNHLSAYQDILRTVKLIAPFLKDFELEPEEKNNELIVLRWKQKGYDDVFSAAQLSDGTLRFICLATLLMLPESLQPSIIIIDEPELGLHPFAITVFSELVKKVSTKKQIILSTQSVDLLNQFDADDVIVADCGDEGSILRRLSAEELSYWIDNEYTLGELWEKNVFGGRLSK